MARQRRDRRGAFDPGRAAGADGAAKADVGSPAGRSTTAGRKRYATVTEAQRLTVSQLSDLIKATLEQRIASPVRVVGEVSNLSVRGHWYFSLKDDAAVIGCVAWASSAKRFGFQPRDGEEVVATGHVSHFGPQGRTQLYVRKMEPLGAGALDVQFRRLCEELRGLGFFDEARKKPLPTFPRRVAVITSKDGAAVRDVIDTARRRCPAVGLLVIDVRVQGDGACDGVARAIAWADANAERLGIDAILVTRGGGSTEDLWTFNERVVAEATFECRLPIVAAIGHESDTTVIELVADRRCATPTQAAMLLVPDGVECGKQVGHLADRLRFVLRRRVEAERQRVEALARHPELRDPGRRLRTERERLRHRARALEHGVWRKLERSQTRVERLAGRLAALHPQRIHADRRARLAVLTERLDGAVRRRVAQRPAVAEAGRRLRYAMQRAVRVERERLTALARELEAVDPLAVLERGFSLTMDEHGQVVRAAGAVAAGDWVTTRVVDGVFESQVGERGGPGGEHGAKEGRPTESSLKPGGSNGGDDAGTRAASARRRSRMRHGPGRRQMDLF